MSLSCGHKLSLQKSTHKLLKSVLQTHNNTGLSVSSQIPVQLLLSAGLRCGRRLLRADGMLL